MKNLLKNRSFQKISVISGILAIAVIAFVSGASNVSAAPWNITGNYVAAVNYLGTDYSHDMVLSQDDLGNLTGHGGSPAGSNVYTWVITSGTVTGNTFDFLANYTATADAVTPQTVLHVMGTIASDGTLSGTWSDNYQGGSRSGTWTTTSGMAAMLAAEDFGVVNYNTGLGILKGYTAGFGLTNATFTNVQSVVVKLYSGSTLLQTNASTAKVTSDITGTQISSPFDVSGTFDYVTDGYWTNVRESQYGQSLPATKVVATVTLSDGRVVTAENTVLTGDPATIYPAVLLGTLSAEDFGVVNYDTGLGMLKGYTSGFGVADATFAGATSVVVKLYSGSTLLQTNTAILPKFNADITGTQFSSPFDVFGNFNYVTDGYWTNVRETEYGQTLIPTKVVATVTLANGKVVTAENTVLTGDTTTIFPPVTVVTNKDACKNGGWKTFTNPSFKNQGQCVSFANHQ